MTEAPQVLPRPDRTGRIFAACLLVALLLHVLSLFALRDATFFGMARLRAEARQLFRVPTLDTPTPALRPHPMRVPDRADVLAAVEEGVRAAMAESLAELPAATVEELPLRSRLESYAEERKVEPAPPRYEAPAQIGHLQEQAAELGRDVIQESVAVVARTVAGEGGAAISQATATALRAEGPTGPIAAAGPPIRAAAQPPPIPAPPPQPQPRVRPPMHAALPLDPTRRQDEAPQYHGERWDQFFDLRLAVYRPDAGEAGYFRLDAIPKSGAALPVAARDVLLVLDASKSMGTDRFSQAQSVFAEAIQALDAKDRFTVVAFQTHPIWWRTDLQLAAPAARADAANWVRKLASEGRTDLYQGLASALATVPTGPRPVVVLLCSDGRPTVGERDSRVLINQLTQRNAGRASIFAYGAGTYVNRYLLDLLAYLNRGAADFGVQPSDMGPGLTGMEASIREPVFLRPQMLIGGAVAEQLYPRALSDIYRGRALRVWGRLKPGTTHMGIRLVGTSEGQPKEILAELPVPPEDNAKRTLAQEWAYQRVFHLVAEVTTHGERPDLVGELAQLGRRYGLPESYIEAASGG